ncbi:DUF6493 family protein [Chryseobacterium sp.]|uniref:DUF6493 family protein n=1 Tax=Chryseobacterium sp. TaxID=1871047 RepID=UPI0023F350B6|nr:DUF6493 family protein [Chryseobacterium sp.]
MRILYSRPVFQTLFSEERNSRLLLSSVYQYCIEGYVMVLNVEMKMNLLSITRLYLFLSLGLFEKYEACGSKAFNLLLDTVFSGCYKEKERKTVIHKKPSFECKPVKTPAYGIFKLIHLIIRCNTALSKLLFSILSAVERKVFNSKKFLSLYNKLVEQNWFEPEKIFVRPPEEWKKINNLKQIYTSN